MQHKILVNDKKGQIVENLSSPLQDNSNGKLKKILVCSILNPVFCSLYFS